MNGRERESLTDQFQSINIIIFTIFIKTPLPTAFKLSENFNVNRNKSATSVTAPKWLWKKKKKFQVGIGKWIFVFNQFFLFIVLQILRHTDDYFITLITSRTAKGHKNYQQQIKRLFCFLMIAINVRDMRWWPASALSPHFLSILSSQQLKEFSKKICYLVPISNRFLNLRA